jgi:predicted nucleotidyltransferase
MNQKKESKLSWESLEKIKERITGKFKVEKIVLFGSYAYGKPRKDSDIDLFIIMETKKRPSERRIMVSRLFRDRESPMDFIVRTPTEVKRRLDMGDFFVKKILERGHIVYERKTG